ncbi:MAG: SDR family NAD(P)-dependent oxidoreductase, partial [Planctomycetes bacterium]|nr:SDR family NAD(P)-dependent oxidoreductase [Planctomycetota bacterium]
GEAAVSEIIDASGNETATFLQADLSLMREVRRAAEHIRQTFDRLDVLVNSAGGTFPGRRTLTDEGFELAFAIQYLARFVLTNELLDLLNAAPAPQVLGIAGGAYGADAALFGPGRRNGWVVLFFQASSWRLFPQKGPCLPAKQWSHWFETLVKRCPDENRG